MIETGTLLQNRYLIEKQIGEGGMGAVYLAIDQRFDSKVAIKETFYKDDELGEAFEREAKLLNSLLHPALPHVSDYFAENNGYFLVMQYIEGEDLFEILKLQGAFPLKDVLHWTDSLLDALDYLHSQEPPIIHRDIKPQNLKITPRGDVILLDFGLAKLSSEDTAAVKSIFGYSRKYSPLEQIQGTGTDVRSDIFALAATVYHLLTGNPPIDALARASAIVGGNPDPLRLASEIANEIPVDVASVLHSALALNADKRFASAKAMRLAFEHAVNALQIESKEELTPLIPVIVSDNSKDVNSTEIEDFTALESFSAETNNSTRTDGETNVDNTEKVPLVVEVPNPAAAAISTPSPIPPLKKSYINGVLTNAVPPTKPRSLRFAALAVLLVCTALSVLYFMAKTNSSSELDENSAVQTDVKPNSDSKNSKVVSAQPSKKSNSDSLSENTGDVKAEISSTEKNAERKDFGDKSAATVEKAANPELASESTVISDSTLAEAPRVRRQAQKTNSESNDQSEEETVVPDIESVFTGRSSDQTDETPSRKSERKQQEDWSEEEVREMRRQRKQEKKPSKTPLPF